MKFQDVLLSPSGRISRQPYWIATLVLVGAGVVASMVPFLNLIFFLASIYFWICVYNKRLHDLGRSGWWQLIPWVAGIASLAALITAFIPILGTLMSGVRDDEAVLAAMLGSGSALLVSGLGGLVGLAFHIWLGLMPGQPGANKYGPNPLNPVDAEVFQ